MSPGILGKKIGMTQIFTADGQVVPVTLVKAGPCIVTQRKTPATDGYDAIQLGLVEYAKKQTKPQAKHLAKSGAEGVRFQREFHLRGGSGDYKQGDRVLADEFKPNEVVDVPPRAWIDWRVELSVARFPRHAHGWAHGHGSSDGAKFGNCERGCRRQRDRPEGCDSGSERRLRDGTPSQALSGRGE